MGNRWDYFIPSVNVWVELLRVLKPGAHAMLFGGTRTFHRLMVAVEDAGFIPVDTCMWMHAKGFPKSLDIAKSIDKRHGRWRGRATSVVSDNQALGGPNYGRTPKGEAVHPDAQRWEGHGTNLKPAWEPVMLCCRLLEGTYAENALRHGTGALAIDACRVGSEVPHLAPAGNDGSTPASIAPVNVTGYEGKTVQGRWPANVVLSHSDECVLRGTKSVRGTVASARRPGGRTDSVARGHMAGGLASSRAAGVEEVEDWECVPDCPVRLLDEQSGTSRGGKPSDRRGRGGLFSPSEDGIPCGPQYGDFGGASRFYYVTKASRAERDRGLEGTAVAERFGIGALGDGGRGKAAVHNDHPTVKPIDLCRYFARLLLPPPREDGRPRRIVVPFCGSGSEMIGCLQAGWDEVVGIELNPKHAEKARLRISRGKILQHSGG